MTRLLPTPTPLYGTPKQNGLCFVSKSWRIYPPDVRSIGGVGVKVFMEAQVISLNPIAAEVEMKLPVVNAEKERNCVLQMETDGVWL